MNLTESTSTVAGAGPPSLDPRIHFDKVSSRWRFEDDDGKEYEWNESKQTWAPVVDDALWEAQQAAYKVDGVDENALVSEDVTKDKKQTKLEKQLQRKTNKKKRQLDSTSITAPPQRNTAIYITRLPLDTTTEELESCFSRAGLILVDQDNKPKIKLYQDSSLGTFNGSALVVYLKSESVDLAIRLFDDTSLRLGSAHDQDRMQVTRAEFSPKPNPSAASSNNERSYQSTEPRPDQKMLQRQKRAKKVEKLKSKLEEWDSEDEKAQSKTSKMVVLEHMFTLEELESDPSLLLDLKEDVREECETLGNVTNVTLYDLEPEGIMTVKFKEPIAAQACIVKMNNRFFAGRQVKAFLYDGRNRYRKTGPGSTMVEYNGTPDATAAEEKERLEAFARFLEDQ